MVGVGEVKMLTPFVTVSHDIITLNLLQDNCIFVSGLSRDKTNVIYKNITHVGKYIPESYLTKAIDLREVTNRFIMLLCHLEEWNDGDYLPNHIEKLSLSYGYEDEDEYVLLSV